MTEEQRLRRNARSRAHHQKMKGDPSYEEKRKIRKRRHELSRYGLTLEDYDRMLEEQEGLCLLCGLPPNTESKRPLLDVDHCHVTGKVRGLVHPRCNVALAWYEKNCGRVEVYLR